MNEFEGICNKYVGIGRNIQGLHEAAKSHLTKAVSSWVDALLKRFFSAPITRKKIVNKFQPFVDSF
jgi:hypothetical protein